MNMIHNTAFLFILLACFVNAADKTRVISKDELAKKNGKDSDELWLSIMGEVYDVSGGKEYYGEGSAYSVFVGKDGSVPFVTGVFTDEEAAKSISSLETKQLMSINHWRDFYRNSDKYPFVGLLEGDLYDKDGNPTTELNQVEERIAKQKKVDELKEAARQERIKQRKLKDAEKAKAQEF